MIPLSCATLYTLYRISTTYNPLSRFVSLSQACEAEHAAGRGEATEGVNRLREGHPVTNSQTMLSRGRYGHTGEGVYAVALVRFPCSFRSSLLSN
jgi:hypothetical protein